MDLHTWAASMVVISLTTFHLCINGLPLAAAHGAASVYSAVAGSGCSGNCHLGRWDNFLDRQRRCRPEVIVSRVLLMRWRSILTATSSFSGFPTFFINGMSTFTPADILAGTSYYTQHRRLATTLRCRHIQFSVWSRRRVLTFIALRLATSKSLYHWYIAAGGEGRKGWEGREEIGREGGEGREVRRKRRMPIFLS